MKRERLGQILLSATDLTEEQLDDALQEQRTSRRRIGEILVRDELVRADDVLAALARQLHLRYVSHIPSVEVDPALLAKIPIEFAKRFKIFPIGEEDGAVVVAVAEPANLEPLEGLRLLLERPLRPVLSNESEILGAINRFYNEEHKSANEMIADLDAQELDYLFRDMAEPADLLDVRTDAPIINLVNSMITEAVKRRASDIHVEPFERSVVVRYRVDGVLHNALEPPKRLQSSIISRIKIMADLDIAEKRKPQDGRISTKIGDKEIDIRVSAVPSAFGERLVLRLLDRSSAILGLEELGFLTEDLAKFDGVIRRPNGIVLLTGPTGSGKTTTLYASLSRINSEEKNIITVEDPIEYRLHGIGQIQVNPKVGLTFANGLRSILRQDPDVIMVGEIRDRETAEIAMQASLTGHLVFSTLHTNDASSALTRMLDMGIEPYLVASTVYAIVAQRLVRLVCNRCKEPVALDPSLVEGLVGKAALPDHVYRGKGCDMCLNSGYRGRTGIYEMLVVDEMVDHATILKQQDAKIMKKEALGRGMRTLLDDGVRKVLKGDTTLEEVFRVTQE